jgi:hypothetical protein
MWAGDERLPVGRGTTALSKERAGRPSPQQQVDTDGVLRHAVGTFGGYLADSARAGGVLENEQPS